MSNGEYIDRYEQWALKDYKDKGADQLIQIMCEVRCAQNSRVARRLLEAKMTADPSQVQIVLDKLYQFFCEVCSPSSTYIPSLHWNGFVNTLELYEKFGKERELDACLAYFDRVKVHHDFDRLRDLCVVSMIPAIQGIATRLERKDVLERLARTVQCHTEIRNWMQDHTVLVENLDRLRPFFKPTFSQRCATAMDGCPRLKRLLRMGQARPQA